MYNQTDFSKALETAGFKRENGLYQPGAIFYKTTFKAGKFTQTVQVSLYPGHLTVSLLIPGKEGLRVVDTLNTSSQSEFLQKTQGWGLK